MHKTMSSLDDGDQPAQPLTLLSLSYHNLLQPARSSKRALPNAMETVNVPELVERLASDEDGVRKMAVFKLQSNIADPSFADVFISEGGLNRLKYLTLNATGNTLGYSLTSFSRLLEVNKGWETIDDALIERVSVMFARHVGEKN